MVGVEVMLGKVVCQVEDAWTPENVEVPLFYSVTNPIKAHVDRFRSSLLYSFVRDPTRTFVVGCDGGGRLGMSHVVKDLAYGLGVFCAVEKGSQFCLRSRG